jgi:dual specificity tyrosine-phosphorylation-regulated kinase 2/3/4
MWSLGCVLAEMMMGRPLFAGRDEIEQIICIIEVLGLPPSYMLERSNKRGVVLDGLRKNNSTKSKIPGSKPLKYLITADHVFMDLLASKI